MGPDAPGRTIRVIFNVPTVDFTWETGAMEVLPGSHHLPRSWGNVHGIANLYLQRLALARGDAVLRDGNTLHRGTPNLGSSVRPMLDQTYKATPAR